MHAVEPKPREVSLPSAAPSPAPRRVAPPLRAFAYTNLLLAATAGGLTITAAVLMGVPVDPRAPFLATASMYLVYTFAKVVMFEEGTDDVNDPDRSALIRRFRVPLLAL